LTAEIIESRLRVKVSAVTGVSGYMIATMSCGASWLAMKSISGLRTARSLPRRTW
jgi:hypothetical protein